MDRLSNLLNSEVATELISKYDLEENDLLFLGIGDKSETVSSLLQIFLIYIFVIFKRT